MHDCNDLWRSGRTTSSFAGVETKAIGESARDGVVSGPAVIQITQRSAFEKLSAQTLSILKLLQKAVLLVRRGLKLLQEVSEEAAERGLHLEKIIRRRKRRTKR